MVGNSGLYYIGFKNYFIVFILYCIYWFCYFGVKWVLRCFVNFIFLEKGYLIYRINWDFVILFYSSRFMLYKWLKENIVWSKVF